MLYYGKFVVPFLITFFSRVLAISASGDQLWEAILSGIVEGTPKINKSGSRIYVAHNTKNKETGEYTAGQIAMIRHDYGTKSGVDLERDGIFGIQGYSSPFAPLTISNADDDLIYFGEKWLDGSASYGSIYECDGTHVRALIRTTWSTAAPPTLSADGKSMWMVGAKSSVHGWVDDRFDGRATWSVSFGDEDKSVAVAPLLTPDESLIFVLTANSTVLCLGARDGNIVWSNYENFLEPKILQLSPDGSFLYAIGNSQGTITQFNAQSGQIIREFSCFDVLDYDSCMGSTEGAFVISTKRNAIYFGDIHGDIIGISIDPEIHSQTKPEILIDPEESPPLQQGPDFLQESFSLVGDLVTPSSEPSVQFDANSISTSNQGSAAYPTIPSPSNELSSPIYMPASGWLLTPAQSPASPVVWSASIPWESYYDETADPTTFSNQRTSNTDTTGTSPSISPNSVAAPSNFVDGFEITPSIDESIDQSNPQTLETGLATDDAPSIVPTLALQPVSLPGDTNDQSNLPAFAPISPHDSTESNSLFAPAYAPAYAPAFVPVLVPSEISEPISFTTDMADLPNLLPVESTLPQDGSEWLPTPPVSMPSMVDQPNFVADPTYPISDEFTSLNDGTNGMPASSPNTMPTILEKPAGTAEDDESVTTPVPTLVETHNGNAGDAEDLFNPSSEEAEAFLQIPNDEVDLVYFEVDLETEMKEDFEPNSLTAKEQSPSSSPSEGKSVAALAASLVVGAIAIMLSGVIIGRLWQQGRNECRHSSSHEEDYNLQAKLNL